MAEVYEFQLDAKQYLNLALDKHRSGDAVSAARYARKAIKSDKRDISAYLVLSFIYSDDNEYELANKVLYNGMNECDAWENAEVRRALALNFMRLDMPETASYYANDSDADLLEIIDDELSADDDFDDVEELYLSYPRTDEYYRRLITQALDLAYDEQFDEAFDLLDSIPDDVKLKADANQAKLMIHTISGDVDKTLRAGEELLEKDPDNAMLRCTVASAYLMKDEPDEARRVAAPILEREDIGLEETLGLLPIAIHLDMHSKVIDLIKRASEYEVKPAMRIMHWFSQALYNVGEKDEARRIMANLRDYYGEYSCATYYLKLYSQNPDRVEYSLTLPEAAKDDLLNSIRDILMMNKGELCEYVEKHDEMCDNFDYYLDYAMKLGNPSLKGALLAKIHGEPYSDRAYKKCLVSDGISYNSLTMLIFALLDENAENEEFEFNIVSQDRFKHIEVCMPEAYSCLTGTLLTATQLSIVDIILTDEEPNFYLFMLKTFLDSFLIKDYEGELMLFEAKYEKLRHMRDPATLAGVFLHRVYRDYDTKEGIINRYGLNARLFDKYHKILFGDEDE